MLLVFSVPVGLHHMFADPEIGAGFKFLQSFLTFFVALPTLLTVFSICASMEIAGRARGGRGLLGWLWALPWQEPMILAVAFSLVMLGLGTFSRPGVYDMPCNEFCGYGHHGMWARVKVVPRDQLPDLSPVERISCAKQ